MDKHQNRIEHLLPGKFLWIAIAAISCAAIRNHYILILSSVTADALIAKTGVSQAVDVAKDIVSRIPLNFDVPKSFQAKTIKACSPT